MKPIVLVLLFILLLLAGCSTATPAPAVQATVIPTVSGATATTNSTPVPATATVSAPTVAPATPTASPTVAVDANAVLLETVVTMQGDAMPLDGPTGIVMDEEGSAYVVDAGNARIVKFDAGGKPLFSFGSKGAGNGQFSFASENTGYIARDSAGNLYVADPDEERISKFSADGKFLAQWAVLHGDTKLFPQFLAMDGKDNLWVLAVDTAKPILVKYDATGKQVGTWDGAKLGISLQGPLAITADKEGRVYLPDLIGIVYTLDGEGKLLDKFSLPPANKLFTTPTGIVRDTQGNFYISDGPNDRVIEVDAHGKLLAVLGKHGTGPGEFFRPYGVALDGQGRLYVVENVNGRVQVFGQKNP